MDKAGAVEAIEDYIRRHTPEGVKLLPPVTFQAEQEAREAPLLDAVRAKKLAFGPAVEEAIRLGIIARPNLCLVTMPVHDPPRAALRVGP